MKTIILAGGLGTRLSEETTARPKPMVEVGGKPILWHIMSIYARQGFNDFVIALGYKGEIIKRYFLDYYYTNVDFTVNLRTGEALRDIGQSSEDWMVRLIHTGFDTQTGGRLKRLKFLKPYGTFFLTYGDGVANIDLTKLLNFHREHGKIATITAVRTPARFGSLEINGLGNVSRFEEKSRGGENWINGGFFVLEPEIFDYIEDDDTLLEKEPMEKLVVDKQLMAYAHEGFWACMDTMRDVRYLNELHEGGEAPWMQ